MNNIIKSIIITLFVVTSASAQHFEGTFTSSGNKLTFKIKPVGGDMTESITYIDFNIRYSPTLNITFSDITNNATDFPGINMQQAAEREFNSMKYKRFVHNTGTVGMKTYMNDVEYEVFTVTLVDPVNAMGDLELVMDLASEEQFPKDFIFSVNNSIGLPITDQTAPYSYFYATQTNPMGSEYVLALNSVALPVELRSFDVTARQSDIQVNWEASTETNLEGYEILRSTDAHNFEKVASVDYDSRKNGSYAYIDAEVSVNTEYYYFLKAVDLDGKTENSNIRSAKINKDVLSEMEIYPNPGRDHFYINASTTQLAEIEIYNLSGVSVLSKVQITESAENTFFINSEALPTGTYIVKTKEEMKRVVLVK